MSGDDLQNTRIKSELNSLHDFQNLEDVAIPADLSDDQKFMAEAISLAKNAFEKNEVPVGAVLVEQGEIIGRGFNQPIFLNDPCAHAEILALRDAANYKKNYRLVDTTLYVSLEPCAMCVGALIHARIQRLVFAASDPKTGAVSSAIQLINAPFFNHKIQVEQGVYAEKSRELLQEFFQRRRKSFIHCYDSDELET